MIGTLIVFVGYAVAITVGATFGSSRTFLIGAGIVFVFNAVAVAAGNSGRFINSVSKCNHQAEARHYIVAQVFKTQAVLCFGCKISVIGKPEVQPHAQRSREVEIIPILTYSAQAGIQIRIKKRALTEIFKLQSRIQTEHSIIVISALIVGGKVCNPISKRHPQTQNIAQRMNVFYLRTGAKIRPEHFISEWKLKVGAG